MGMSFSTTAEALVSAQGHFQAGRLSEAEADLNQILSHVPQEAEALHLLGLVWFRRGQGGEAARLISQSLATSGGNPAHHLNLGLVLKQLGRRDEAASCFQRAVELAPGLTEAHFLLGEERHRQARLDDAIAHYRLTVALKPDHVGAHNNLGLVFGALNRPADSVASYRAAIAISPDNASLYFNLGVALDDLGQYDKAIAAYRTAISLRPDHAMAHNNLALDLLARGEMAAGWREYEWRWQCPELSAVKRAFTQPQWQGEAAPGKVLLVHAEQGLGDSLQFCRYIPVAASLGLTVVLEVPKPLVRLLSGLDGVAQVIESGGELPAFDFHCPMLSLPFALRDHVQGPLTVGRYLAADSGAAALWRQRLDAIADPVFPRVGLVWAGLARRGSARAMAVDRRRSMTPDLMQPLWVQPGFSFVSLQKNGDALPTGAPVMDFMSEMADLADTAALIENLDLVVSVDTAMAHLAGAMGKPVWLLDRVDPCWRWLRDREDSPWYPSLRIFRQTQAGDWAGVIQRVKTALAAESYDAVGG